MIIDANDNHTFVPTLDPYSEIVINDFFSSMQLPIPRNYPNDYKKDEIYGGTGDRHLVFVTEYGFVVRITPEKSLMPFDNRHFLRSLFNRKAAHYTIDIDPGYDTPVTVEQKNTIYRMMMDKFSIMVTDGKPHNLAFVPGTDYPVLLDLDPRFTVKTESRPPTASRFENALRAVKNLLISMPQPVAVVAEPEIQDPQHEIYAPLRKIITAAWPADARTPDPEGIRKFKRACKAFKEAGKLVTPWDSQEKDYKGIFRNSRNYAARIAEAEPAPLLHLQKLTA